MAISRGKQFEDKIREQFNSIADTFCLRLYDITMGYKQINNPCDFIVYKYGTLNLFECKAIHSNTLNFKSHIRQNQWDKMLEYSKISGVNAGIICWFIPCDKTIFIPMQSLQLLKDEKFKSFNCNYANSNLYNDLNIKSFEINGTKKRVFFKYNLEKFLKEISYE